jgi:hypothetical protein
MNNWEVMKIVDLLSSKNLRENELGILILRQLSLGEVFETLKEGETLSLREKAALLYLLFPISCSEILWKSKWQGVWDMYGDYACGNAALMATPLERPNDEGGLFFKRTIWRKYGFQKHRNLKELVEFSA